MRGGKTWVYLDGKSWVQCTNCGKVHRIPQLVPIDKLYVIVNCPDCGITKNINLGNDLEDRYYFYDVTLDERYY